jgi:hypothetical protein
MPMVSGIFGLLHGPLAEGSHRHRQDHHPQHKHKLVDQHPLIRQQSIDRNMSSFIDVRMWGRIIKDSDWVINMLERGYTITLLGGTWTGC